MSYQIKVKKRYNTIYINGVIDGIVIISLTPSSYGNGKWVVAESSTIKQNFEFLQAYSKCVMAVVTLVEQLMSNEITIEQVEKEYKS